MPGAIERPVDQRLYESVNAASGAIIVIPGLNNKPTIMDPLIETMTTAGFHCLRVSLYQSHPIETITAERIANRWIHQVSQAYERLQTDYPMLPILNLSYSIGALVTLCFLQTNASALFRGMAFFAPAVALTRSARFLQLIKPLGFSPLGYLGLPSLAPDMIRARPATPLREYAAMLSLVDDVQLLTAAKRIRDVLTKVFINHNDEVVSYQGTDRWIRRNRLHAWKLEHVPVKSRYFRHLVVSPLVLDHDTWNGITRELMALFQRTVGSSAVGELSPQPDSSQQPMKSPRAPSLIGS